MSSTIDSIESLATAVKDATRVINQVGEGSVQQAAKAGASLQTITQAIGHISDMSTQIASASEEQSSVAEKINRNVTSINAVFEQNAAASNQITASSEKLARLASNLQGLIAQFEV